MEYEPERISVDADAVEITWTDGISTTVTGRRLRAACPCAECRDHESRTTSIIRLDHRSEIADAHLIGGYAIRFTYGDGHADGIYPYHLLRGMGEDT